MVKPYKILIYQAITRLADAKKEPGYLPEAE